LFSASSSFIKIPLAREIIQIISPLLAMRPLNSCSKLLDKQCTLLDTDWPALSKPINRQQQGTVV